MCSQRGQLHDNDDDEVRENFTMTMKPVFRKEEFLGNF
jgi:hypothetical protein